MQNRTFTELHDRELSSQIRSIINPGDFKTNVNSIQLQNLESVYMSLQFLFFFLFFFFFQIKSYNTQAQPEGNLIGTNFTGG